MVVVVVWWVSTYMHTYIHLGTLSERELFSYGFIVFLTSFTWMTTNETYETPIHVTCSIYLDDAKACSAEPHVSFGFPKSDMIIGQYVLILSRYV